MRERELERKLVKAVERIGGQAPKWVSPGERGVPDRIVIMPHGKTYYVELKSETGQLHPLQARWIRKLLGLGHKAYVVDSEESLQNFIDEVKADGV